MNKLMDFMLDMITIKYYQMAQLYLTNAMQPNEFIPVP